MDIKKQLPRDVFLYLLAMVGLAMASVNFGTLLFQFINLYVPDYAIDPYPYRDGTLNAIRWAISTLVFIFPAFFFVSRFLSRDIALNPEKRELRIRKWLLYLTLSVTALVIIGDLIALMYGYLQGDLTLRFGLKILSILFIAGSIFFYYRNELSDKPSRLKPFISAIVAIIVITVVAGFVVAGSPASQREVRFDEQRVMHLQSLQSRTISFWQHKERLPGALSELEDVLSGFRVPVDPETGEQYSYYASDDQLSFRLCATFVTDTLSSRDKAQRSEFQMYPQKDNWTWLHAIGNTCFERTIDPELYPQTDEQPRVIQPLPF